MLFSKHGVGLLVLCTAVAGCGGSPDSRNEANPAPGATGKTDNAADDAASKTDSGETAGSNETFTWPAAPDAVETISGHWQLGDEGEIFFEALERKDDIGFAYRSGTYVPAAGDPLSFQWELRQDGFAEVQEGLDYYFETLIGLTADVELFFAPNSAATLRFEPGNYKSATLSWYLELGALETAERTLTRIDDRQTP